jgi:hypothetical protein
MTVRHNPGDFARLNAAHAGTSIAIVEGSSPFLKSVALWVRHSWNQVECEAFRQWLNHAGRILRGYFHLDL